MSDIQIKEKIDKMYEKSLFFNHEDSCESIRYKLNKKFNRFFFIFLILFISILASKAHDDFSYYHFPYTYNLINNDLILGIGHLNHGFRTISSIFYFNSLLYLPIINYNLFHLTPILVLGSKTTLSINPLGKISFGT